MRCKVTTSHQIRSSAGLSNSSGGMKIVNNGSGECCPVHTSAFVFSSSIHVFPLYQLVHIALLYVLYILTLLSSAIFIAIN